MGMRFLLFGLTLVSAWPVVAIAEPAEISEWLVPWERTSPVSPFVDQRGRVWFAGQRGDYVANLSPESGEFSRYDLERGAEPHSLVVGNTGLVWFTGARQRYIGRLNPANGRVDQYEMTDSKARGPGALVFDSAGNIWFTVAAGNFVGKLTVSSGSLRLSEVATRKARPSHIVINSRDEPWAAASGRNLLLRIDPDSMAIAEIELPDKKARPLRLVTTSDDHVWWADHARGYLGSYDPDSGRFAEWPMPGGENSEPWGMAVDHDDRIWIAESGPNPNTLVGFDTRTSRFFSTGIIPSGGNGVQDMYYFEPAGEVWFATGTNYIGRASIH